MIASLRRWAARDGVGQRLFSFTDKLEAVDDKTFRMTLKKPYGMVLESLGKTGTSVAVIMRAQEAATDPQQQVKEASARALQVRQGPVGAGQQGGVSQERRLRAAPEQREGRELRRLEVRRSVDRIELVWISDPQTAMSALINGEIDFYENPNIDFLPDPGEGQGREADATGKIDSTHGMIRLNHLHPPFNNVKARQAMYYLINQEDFLRAIVGDPKYYRVCHGLITCGSPLGNDGGSQWFKEYNPKKALQLLKEAGYNGEPITVLAATDHNTITPATQVLIQAMREAGINVDAQSMDWGSVVSRRAKKEPPAQGGWNIFVTTTGGVGSSNPVLHTWIGAACDKGLFGWPCDAEIEKLRNDYGFAQTDEEKTKIARDLQTRAMEQVVYIPFGQWDAPARLSLRPPRRHRAQHRAGPCSGTSTKK